MSRTHAATIPVLSLHLSHLLCLFLSKPPVQLQTVEQTKSLRNQLTYPTISPDIQEIQHTPPQYTPTFTYTSRRYELSTSRPRPKQSHSRPGSISSQSSKIIKVQTTYCVPPVNLNLARTDRITTTTAAVQLPMSVPSQESLAKLLWPRGFASRPPRESYG
ncbi:uncharacterized protein BO97DRAFT_127177 [Aspergillus homomorphus CBS 101889]|uniref:Uncharacterized protein n=1 Tax=Aspergillus homomorphus (strain CBS 101889) TaxID=1450537 RepID=A0A395HSK8_ASPHC|nr:hypothetical protein BO97DRAFT_127177 [Aspergillus homomorphus CBS 101889]RAL10479.1 hypothetical protein BO97DRAFT_127177 [Aspergillus homomorphus CBS 101889]